MKVDFIPKHIVSFVKEKVPKLIIEQQKKIILIVSIVLGLCCMLYWIRSRSLSGRVKKMPGDTNLERKRTSSQEKNETRDVFDELEPFENGLGKINQKEKEGSPLSTAPEGSSKSNDDLESESNGSPRNGAEFELDAAVCEEEILAVFTSSGENLVNQPSIFPGESLETLTKEVNIAGILIAISEEQKAADGHSQPGWLPGEIMKIAENNVTDELTADFSENRGGEPSAIEQLEDEIHQDGYSCLDYLVEEFSVKADDVYYTSDGKRKKTFVHELDFLKEGYQLRKSAIEKPKEEGGLLYFKGTLPESIQIVEDQENESATLRFQISWGEEEALPSTNLWARELKSVLESRDTLYNEVKNQLEEEKKEQEKKKSQLTLLRKSVIQDLFSQKFLHPDR